MLAAIGITTAMDAGGLAAFSAFPLFPLMGLFWYLQRFSRADVGFVWGKARHYGLAVLFPLAVLSVTAFVAAMTGAVDISETDWQKAGLHLALVASSTIIVATFTEEGFFRGWLWAALRRAGLGKTGVLVLSSLAFALWHVSAVMLETGFNPPPAQIPVYLVNIAVLGGIWGALRSMSGSVVVASVSHGIWNGIAYGFFGFGAKVGALGIGETAIYGPEVGVLGLLLNLIFAVVLWRWCKSNGGGGACRD